METIGILDRERKLYKNVYQIGMNGYNNVYQIGMNGYNNVYQIGMNGYNMVYQIEEEGILLTIYAPMIYTAPCVMVLMGADSA